MFPHIINNVWRTVLPLFAACCLLVACGNVQNEFSARPCHVIIDNSIHLDPTLASAMNAMSPGVYCEIRESVEGGARYYTFASNQGLQSKKLLTAIDLRVTRIVGLNNGIIVGFGNLDNPATFYAYDRECPNCFNPDAMPVRSHPLKIDEKGWATCATCHRNYDLNNRGFIINGEQGQPLTRFPARCSGPFAMLSVY